MPDQSKQEHLSKDDSLRCSRCQYLLQGLAGESECPECGFPIALSRSQASSVSARQLFTLAVRLIALLLLLQLVNVQSEYLRAVFQAVMDPSIYGLPYILKLSLPALVVVTASVVLWFIAPQLANLSVPKDAPLLTNTGGPRSMLLIVLCLFSLWLAIQGLQDIVIFFYGVAFGEWFWPTITDRIHDEDVGFVIFTLGSLKLLSGVILLLVCQRFWKD